MIQSTRVKRTVEDLSRIAVPFFLVRKRERGEEEEGRKGVSKEGLETGRPLSAQQANDLLVTLCSATVASSVRCEDKQFDSRLTGRGTHAAPTTMT